MPPGQVIPRSSQHLSENKVTTAIEYLEGQQVTITLRDTTVLNGCLERIGWMNPDSEAICYLCFRADSDSNYVLTAQGSPTTSGILFIPWDWVAFIALP